MDMQDVRNGKLMFSHWYAVSSSRPLHGFQYNLAWNILTNVGCILGAVHLQLFYNAFSPTDYFRFLRQLLTHLLSSEAGEVGESIDRRTK
jgi:hypothetical protein